MHISSAKILSEVADGLIIVKCQVYLHGLITKL